MGSGQIWDLRYREFYALLHKEMNFELLGFLLALFLVPVPMLFVTCVYNSRIMRNYLGNDSFCRVSKGWISICNLALNIIH